MMCMPGTLSTAALPNCQSRLPSPRLIIVESTTVLTSCVKVEPSVTWPAALIATSCPSITLAMSADLLMSPMDTCKFGGMGCQRDIEVSSRLVQTRSLGEPAEALVLECVGRYCRLLQEGRFSQTRLENGTVTSREGFIADLLGSFAAGLGYARTYGTVRYQSRIVRVPGERASATRST